MKLLNKRNISTPAQNTGATLSKSEKSELIETTLCWLAESEEQSTAADIDTQHITVSEDFNV